MRLNPELSDRPGFDLRNRQAVRLLMEEYSAALKKREFLNRSREALRVVCRFVTTGAET